MDARLLYREIGGSTGQDVWLYSVDDRTFMLFLRSAANEWSAAFSPDGDWVAYVSDESAVAELNARPFAGSGPRNQVSIDAGTAPVWSRDGRELFFAKGRHAVRCAPVTTGGTFTGGTVRRLFSGPYKLRRSYSEL